MSSMLKSSGTMAIATLLSRILGLCREMVYAWFMGAGPVAGAFILAFMIPNLFRRLLGEGALTAAFIPIFKEKEKLEGDDSMWEAANAVLSGLILAAGVTCLVGIAGITLFLSLHEIFGLQSMISAETRLMLQLLRIMFPYLVLVCVAALFMAMLNSRGCFFLPAMGATLLNVVMIGAVWFLAPHWGGELPDQIFALAFAVLLAGLLQATFQLPALNKQGYRLHWRNPLKSDVVKSVLHKMIPGAIGVAAFQINVLATKGIAFWHDESIVATFEYAVRLMEMPQGVFGISLATFLLPALAGLAAEKDYRGFRATLMEGMGHLFFINLFAGIMLVILAEPIIHLLFERGEFNAYSTQRSSLALAFLAPGLIAFSLNNILARAFYALGDTRIPMLIASFCLILNIFLTLWFLFPLKEAGLGLANSITSSLNTGLLIYALNKKIKFFAFEQIKKQLIASLICAVLAGCVGQLSYLVCRGRLPGDSFGKDFILVFVPMLFAGWVYLAVAWAQGHPTTRELLDMVRKQKNIAN